MTSVSPTDAGEFSRDNYAVNADLEHIVSDEMLLQYALRYEDFSDFGSTLNWKVAARYDVTDDFVLRGAVSTGSTHQHQVRPMSVPLLLPLMGQPVCR